MKEFWVDKFTRLETIFSQVHNIILSKQNQNSGLIPASVAITTHGNYTDAWVRDNVYSILCVWGLSLAYKNIDDDLGRAYELEHATIKCMRGLLISMMRQASKVEKFKDNQNLGNSLHAKYNTDTGFPVVGDYDWGHLQIDATSIFLLFLAQMTASGLQIVYTMDEVCLIQNLVFYIERAYRTPDFGIWERGNKINHGDPELNSSSIGMCVAALQAINGLNLFGARGSAASIIHVLPDEITRNMTTLNSSLPRESYSKEVDAALLSVISYPAFAVQDIKLVERTRNEIIKKLGGTYGCKRFLRDGHQTLVENTSRLHYEPHELRVFEGIECEWPLFFTYLILDGLFTDNPDQVKEYREKLDKTLVDSPHAANLDKSERLQLVPELFIVPEHLIDAEKKNPGSQTRIANENTPLVWAQSLKILGDLIHENLIAPADLDPLGRRLIPKTCVTNDVVVQVVLLSESAKLQATMAMFGLDTQTLESCSPISVSNPSSLRDAYTFLGQNAKLGLTGRPKRPMGTLSTCKLYRCQGKLYAFLPHFMDREEFYLVSDNDYLVSKFEQELSFIKGHWSYTGRPTMVVMLTAAMLGGINSSNSSAGDRSPASSGVMGGMFKKSSNSKKNLLNFFMGLRGGMCGNTRVRCGRLSEMVNTACIESLDFLVGGEAFLKGDPLQQETKNNFEIMLKSSVPCASPVDNDRLRTTDSSRNSNNDNFGSVSRRKKLRRRTASAGSERSLGSVSERSVGVESALDSPMFTEGPTYGSTEEIPDFKLNDHVDDRTFFIDAYSGNRVSRTLSPTRMANRSNRFPKGLLLKDRNDGTISEDARELFAFNPSGSLSDGSGTIFPALDKEEIPVLSSEDVDVQITLSLNDPTHVSEAVDLLRNSSNIYDQIDILHYLFSCNGLKFVVHGLGTIEALLEEVYFKATYMKQWTIVRQAAGLLRKVVNSMTVNVADLLVRQKPVTVGFGKLEFFMTSPLSPSALQDIIYTHCASDVREAPLVQEIITYLGSFIRSSSNLFDGIMRVRTHFFIIAMREEISRMKGCDEEEAVEELMQLSPFEMKSLLGQVLNSHYDAPNIYKSSFITPYKLRNINVSKSRSSLSLNQQAGLPLISNLTITTQSGGYHAGNFARIEMKKDGKGEAINHIFSRGMNVCLIDPKEGAVIESGSFDTHKSPEDSEDLARVLDWLDAGTIVIICAKDECVENLTDNAKTAISALGSKLISNVQYRDSWCLIAEKGGETVKEFHRAAKDGPTDSIQKVFDLSKQREKILESCELSSKIFLPSNGTWLRRRKNDGALNRVPPSFYPKVWKVLSKCQGILIGRECLRSDPTIYEKTPEEFNFALQVESLLDVIKDPAERQIAADCLVVISKLQERNPEIQIRNTLLDLISIIRDAIQRYWQFWIKAAGYIESQHVTKADLKDNKAEITASNPLGLNDYRFEKNEKFARRLFFDLPEEGENGTHAYLAQSCVKLAFNVKWTE